LSGEWFRGKHSFITHMIVVNDACEALKKKYCEFITYRWMDDKTDLNNLLHNDFSNIIESIKKVPSLPELKPHFIVKEYCGRPRRESHTLYLEENVVKDKIDENDMDKQKKKQSGGIIEKMALFGGVMFGGAIGLYIYGTNSGE